MPPTRTTLVLAGGAAVLVAAGALGALALGGDDPSIAVDAVEVGDVSGATVEGSSAGGTVLALEELSGALRVGTEDVVVGGVELDLGPDSFVRGGGPVADFDADGSAEPLLDELAGLDGTDVRLLVRFDDDRDEADVYVINSLDYRDTAGGPPPWELAPEGVADRDTVAAAAVAAVGEGARLVELDPEDDGGHGWEAEVVDARGREHTVLLDADGTVLAVEADD